MPKIAHEIAAALHAVAIARRFVKAAEPEAGALDLQLWQLLKAGSPILRAEMAKHFAHATAGPPRTLRALACDPDPEVAGPVLRHSPAISDAAIAEMARCKGDGHLEAIAARPHLNERIAGVLARRGGPKVLETLAGNPTAAFSAEGRYRLEMRLRHHRLASRRAERRDGLGPRAGSAARHASH